MSFESRQIEFSLADEKDIITFSGLRCHASVFNPGGNTAFAQAQLRVWGLSLQIMSRFSSAGANMIALENKTVRIRAGNQGSVLNQIFEGTIFSSQPDFSGAPNVCLSISASSGLFQKVKPAKAAHYSGAQDAEKIIEDLARRAGFRFQNINKAHAVIQDKYVYGSLVDQMQDIANDALLPICIENGTVFIWPNDGTRDDSVIKLSPKSGLIGYPGYYDAGFVVKSEFNPMIANGRIVELDSELPRAKGRWPTQNVAHQLACNDPGMTDWFTIATLSPALYVNP